MPPPPACARTGLKATWTWPPTKPSPVLHADDGSHGAAGVSPRALRCSIHQRAGLRHGRPARPSCGSSGRQVRIREPAPPVSVRCEPTQPSGAGRLAEPAPRGNGVVSISAWWIPPPQRVMGPPKRSNSSSRSSGGSARRSDSRTSRAVPSCVRRTTPTARRRRSPDHLRQRAPLRKSEVKMGIIIDWSTEEDIMIEHLDCIDPDNPEGLQSVKRITTRDWWPREKRWVPYNVECRIERNGQGASGGHIIVLTYKKKNNSHLKEGDMIPGTNRIFIEPEQNRGVCKWQSADDGEELEYQWQRK